VTVPTYATTTDMLSAHPFIRAKAARYRVARLLGADVGTADEARLYDTFAALQGAEAAKAAKESRAMRRTVNVHKKPLRAARRSEAALYGFAFEGGKVVTGSIGG
jgi:hypothetical protein